MLRTKSTILALTCLSLPLLSVAQDDDKITVSGSIQSDILFPQEDTKIGAKHYSETALTNSFAEVNVTSKHGDAGMRFEYLDHPLPGFDKDYKGYGVPYFYVKGHWQRLEVTLGNFYEQFGSGFILRTYEERSLGIDNSLRGARVMVKPFNGVTFKTLTGQQRRYWDYNDSWITGADLELNLDQWLKGLQNRGAYLTLGASYVNKHEKADEDVLSTQFPNHKYRFPANVGAFDVRLRYQQGGLNVLAEYAQKAQDPTSGAGYTLYNNGVPQKMGYIYRKGYVAMLSASYSKKGMSVLLQAKRNDNMTYRSLRTPSTDNSSYINHLPAFTMEHTYTLAAHYPYATQLDGEWAYQAELGYNFKRHTLLGGKYGTKVKLNYSLVESIDKNIHQESTDGYGSSFWKWGDDRYYQDLNVQVEKKLSKSFKLNLMYMNQFYNKTAIEGEGGMIHSNIFVAEGKYQFNNKFTLRSEAQYLTTGEDDGDWAFGLLELSVLPHFMFTISDEYNCGTTDIHYYNGSVTFTAGSHRLQVGYGRTRAGYNCTGGVCRYVPATKGVTVSYNYNF